MDLAIRLTFEDQPGQVLTAGEIQSEPEWIMVIGSVICAHRSLTPAKESGKQALMIKMRTVHFTFGTYKYIQIRDGLFRAT